MQEVGDGRDKHVRAVLPDVHVVFLLTVVSRNRALENLELLVDERGVQLLSSYIVATRAIPSRDRYEIVCDSRFLLVVVRDGSTEPLAAAAIETHRWLVDIAEVDETTASQSHEDGVAGEVLLPFDQW